MGTRREAARRRCPPLPRYKQTPAGCRQECCAVGWLPVRRLVSRSHSSWFSVCPAQSTPRVLALPDVTFLPLFAISPAANGSHHAKFSDYRTACKCARGTCMKKLESTMRSRRQLLQLGWKSAAAIMALRAPKLSAGASDAGRALVHLRRQRQQQHDRPPRPVRVTAATQPPADRWRCPIAAFCPSPRPVSLSVSDCTPTSPIFATCTSKKR